MFLQMWMQQFNSLTSSPNALFSARPCERHLSHMNAFIIQLCETNLKKRPTDSTVLSIKIPQAMAWTLLDASLANMTTTGSMKAFTHAVSSTYTTSTSTT